MSEQHGYQTKWGWSRVAGPDKTLNHTAAGSEHEIEWFYYEHFTEVRCSCGWGGSRDEGEYVGPSLSEWVNFHLEQAGKP